MELDPPRPPPGRNWSERVRDWLVWFGVARVATIALSVLAVGAGGYWLVRPVPDPVESSLPRAGTAAAPEPANTTTSSAVPAIPEAPALTEIVVHVAGAVNGPGVHRLPPGARVVDAVVAAGGAAPDAVLDAINLAQPLHDGDRVVVPSAASGALPPAGVTAAATPAATGGAAGQPVTPLDLNAATAAQLETLPGIGPATAQAIVAHREANGPFSSVDGLADVRGIGPAKLDAIRALVTV